MILSLFREIYLIKNTGYTDAEYWKFEKNVDAHEI